MASSESKHAVVFSSLDKIFKWKCSFCLIFLHGWRIEVKLVQMNMLCSASACWVMSTRVDIFSEIASCCFTVSILWLIICVLKGVHLTFIWPIYMTACCSNVISLISKTQLWVFNIIFPISRVNLSLNFRDKASKRREWTFWLHSNQ